MKKEKTYLPEDGEKHLKRQLKFEQRYLEDLKKIKQSENGKQLENSRRRYLNKETEKTKKKIQELDQKLDEVKR